MFQTGRDAREEEEEEEDVCPCCGQKVCEATCPKCRESGPCTLMWKKSKGKGEWSACTDCRATKNENNKRQLEANPGQVERHRTRMRDVISPKNNPDTNALWKGRRRVQTPKAKAAVRNSQAKAQALAVNFGSLTEPHVDVLVTNKKELKAFVDKHPELKQVLVRPLEQIVALDSATGKAKWTEPPSKDGSKPAGSMFLKGRDPSRSHTGTDLLMFTAYSEKHQEWFYACRSGGDSFREGVVWLVRKWKKGGWNNKRDFSEATCNKKMTEVEAQEVFLKFVGGDTCIEYNLIDSHRINTWLDIHKKKNVPFFDVGRGVCYPQGRAKSSIFSHKQPISRSVNGKLQTITDDLFKLKGSSFSQPSSSAVGELGIGPHITEVNVSDEDLKDSDEPLDVQRVMNLFVVLRKVYHLAVQEEEKDDDDDDDGHDDGDDDDDDDDSDE